MQRFNIADLELGPLAVGLVCFGIAVLGFLFAFGVKKTRRPEPSIPLPRRGPFDSVVQAIRTRTDPLLLIALLGSAFFYFASTLVLAILHELCIERLGFSHSQTNVSMGALAIGIAVGALVAAKLVITGGVAIIVAATFYMSFKRTASHV